MTTDRLRRYNAAIAHSGLLAPAGPFSLVDMQRLTYGAVAHSDISCMLISRTSELHTPVIHCYNAFRSTHCLPLLENTALLERPRTQCFVFLHQRVCEYFAFIKLNVHHPAITGCGAACTEDGIHYSNSTYDAALQVWANALALSLREHNGMVPSGSSGLL